ncbi:MAG: ABC transporter ATP-binding protein [Planctomycetaceae bacterium]|nr:ABC transporter ATP-binding protein [Planctomycetaceae bacterium]
MISVVNVTQHYGVKPVLKRIDLDIPSGCRVAVIGPNGMGKTTLLSVIAGILVPQKGYVESEGIRRRNSVEEELEIRRKTVFLPDRCWLPKMRTGREFILGVGAMYGVDMERLLDHADRLLALFELSTLAEAPIRTYSSGQQKKISLCSALITDAPILLLDEPFSGGLDPAGILAMKCLLQRMADDEDRTIVFTAPVPELVEETADRLVVLKQGEVAAEGTLQDLKRQAGGGQTLDAILERIVFPETLAQIDAYFEGEEKYR